MSQPDYDLAILTNVSLACDDLTDSELNSLYLSALTGTDPTQVQGYDKVHCLFKDNRMHPRTIQALAMVWEDRCTRH